MTEIRVTSVLPYSNHDRDLLADSEADAVAEALRRVGPNRPQITLDTPGPHTHYAVRHICWEDDNTVRDTGWRGWTTQPGGHLVDRFIGPVNLADLFTPV